MRLTALLEYLGFSLCFAFGIQYSSAQSAAPSGLSQRIRYYGLVGWCRSTSNVWGVHLPSRL